jgi:hypothetical protein
VSYKPTPFDNVPGINEALIRGLNRELNLISDETNFPTTDGFRLKVWHEEPPRVAEGMFFLADGTNWDPGSGQGLYRYQGGAWNKVG